MDTPEVKPWWKSRTVWLNVAVGMVAVVEANLSLVQSELKPALYLTAMSFVTGLNIFLRFATTQPVK